MEIVWNLHKFRTSPWYGTTIKFFYLSGVGKILLEMLLIGMRCVTPRPGRGYST